MRSAGILVVTAVLCGCASLPVPADPASDAPEHRVVPGTPVSRYGSYREALAAWRRPEDVNGWIGAMFEYDADRSLRLSESQRAEGRAPSIVDPIAFHDKPKGVCVDLARFAVETLNHVTPELKAKYLMIEFQPAVIRGQMLRRHWVALYAREGSLYVFADSKRPGVIAGPYLTVADFIAEYARYRGREIVAYRELQSYKRRTRAISRQRLGDS